MESLLLFLALLAIPSAIGAISYFYCRKIKPTSTRFLVTLLAYLICTLFGGVLNIGILFLFVGLALSRIGTWAHKKSSHAYESGWESPYLLVLTSILTSLLAGSIFFVVFMNRILASVFATYSWVVVIIPLYFFTLVISPSLMPFLIWMVQSLEQRPGVDKHFED